MMTMMPVFCLFLVLFGAPALRGQLTPGVLEEDPNINGNTYVFTLGGCGDECGCKDGCCNKTLLQERQVDYLKNDTRQEDTIGFGTSFQPLNAKICDMAPNWTAVYQKPFQFNGRLEKVQFLICEDCGDESAAKSTLNATKNVLLRLGVFSRSGLDGSCSFALKGYIELKRANYPAWDSFLATAPDPSRTAPANTIPFEYKFTDADLTTMGVADYAIEGLHFGFQWSSAGCVCYQKWPKDNAWINDRTMCIGTAFGSFSDEVNRHVYRTIDPKPRQQGRRYNMKVYYVSA